MLDLVSVILKILSAAALAFPRSGPNYCAYPAAIAPNIMAKIATKISVGLAAL